MGAQLQRARRRVCRNRSLQRWRPGRQYESHRATVNPSPSMQAYTPGCSAALLRARHLHERYLPQGSLLAPSLTGQGCE